MISEVIKHENNILSKMYVIQNGANFQDSLTYGGSHGLLIVRYGENGQLEMEEERVAGFLMTFIKLDAKGIIIDEKRAYPI